MLAAVPNFLPKPIVLHRTEDKFITERTSFASIFDMTNRKNEKMKRQDGLEMENTVWESNH